jgi:hypothetical protein
MADASQLTRAGRLQEATDQLQRGLRGAGPPATAQPTVTEPFRSRRDAPVSGMPGAGGLGDRLQARLPVGLPGNSPWSGPAAPLPRRLRLAPRRRDPPPHSHRAAGSRTYDLYLPTGYTGEPVPLVVMLHGGTQDATDFAAGTRMNDLAEQHTFIVAAEQSTAANYGRYWNWFRPRRPAA